ncbi:MAG: aminodeoxychorismate/anthranilate synthase component II [Pseudobacteriovorax sp.]|nr:aminodeoxychorismate/anthranilate synthase component II [Pseudobacteriovorax sp.]
MILIIDNYDSFTHNLYQLIGTITDNIAVVRNDAISVEQIRELDPKRIVISPGPSNPDNAGISLEVVRAFGGLIPILGVCLGYQCIGQAFGARIIRSPEGPVHGKQFRIKHNESGLFRNVENEMLVARYHSLVIDRNSLPQCLEITATCGNLIMGIKHKEISFLEGIQFHPESFLTPQGVNIIRNFLDIQKDRDLVNNGIAG